MNYLCGKVFTGTADCKTAEPYVTAVTGRQRHGNSLMPEVGGANVINYLALWSVSKLKAINVLI